MSTRPILINKPPHLTVDPRTWTSTFLSLSNKNWYIYIRYYTDEHHHALKINFNIVNISFGPRCGALNIQSCSAPRSSEINFNVTTLILASWLLNWFNYRILLADIDQPSLKGGVYPCNWLWCISSQRGAQWCGQTRNSVMAFKGRDSAHRLEEHHGPKRGLWGDDPRHILCLCCFSCLHFLLF